MRSDMARLLVLRGHYRCPKPRTQERGPLEDRPLKQSMSRKRVGYGGFNEYLAPLRRFIDSRVGKKWDDVYSELRELVAPNNAIQMHIFQHLWDYVERQPIFIDGVPHHPHHVRWGRGAMPVPMQFYPRGRGWYVDLDGLLRRCPPRLRRRRRP